MYDCEVHTQVHRSVMPLIMACGPIEGMLVISSSDIRSSPGVVARSSEYIVRRMQVWVIGSLWFFANGSSKRHGGLCITPSYHTCRFDGEPVSQDNFSQSSDGPGFGLKYIQARVQEQD